MLDYFDAWLHKGSSKIFLLWRFSLVGRASWQALHRKVWIFGKVFSLHNFVQKDLIIWNEVEAEVVCCCRFAGYSLL